jgi:addiction module HigA family antidote
LLRASTSDLIQKDVGSRNKSGHDDRKKAMRRRRPAYGVRLNGFRLAPVHPGETLAEEIEARGLSAPAPAQKLRVSANRITEIINGKSGVSAETALRLGRHFGTGAAFWMNLQSQYDLALAERELGKTIEKEVEAA